MSGTTNPFHHLVEALDPKEPKQRFFNLSKLGDPRYERLPFSIRVLLESAMRNCDGFLVKREDVESILDWQQTQAQTVEVPFRPARVILQDFTGVPAVVDFAAMRDAVTKLGGDPEKINPVCPADLVIDHSIQKNQDLEFDRNKERFQFLKWGSKAFRNMRIIPPGSGIVHQVNLEYLARVVFNQDGYYYPDSLVGTDSHTTMIDGLGVLGWGVGGIEAEAVMLGQPISMVLPQVVGYKLFGTPDKFITSTDIVLTVTKHLRQVGVVGKFVEFFGPGVSQLSIADRATIANMCPEYGATAAFFPVDDVSVKYLEQTGRDAEKLGYITKYLKAVAMFRDYNNVSQDPDFTQVVEMDLSAVVPCCSGPKRPQDRIAVSDMKSDFESCLGAKVVPESHQASVPFQFNGAEYALSHGSKAVERGLSVKPYIKTSLSPGSGVVTSYLKESGVMDYLFKLGFEVVGYGCMTCIGNSGPLPEPVGDLVAAGILSGNRNFEGRVHPNTRANYLASPPLVFLRDIWPTREEIQAVESQFVIPSMFKEVYEKIEKVNERWNALCAPSDKLYPWDPKSTYIKSPPFFEGLTMTLEPPRSVHEAYVLLNLGDSLDVFDAAERYQQAGSPLLILAGKEYGSGSSRDWAAKGPFLLLDVFDAAERYQQAGSPLLILAGKEYGSGSSRDWAAKGPFLLSYERIHRSNLVGMGVIPLEYLSGDTADTLGLSGRERYTVLIPEQLTPRMLVDVKLNTGKSFQVRMRFDTDVELAYFLNGGILNYMIRKMSGK
ncbi:hypothetical protein CRUP_035837 [Coryphaenoides rupestris]|nr:hypothetical protein CRUP_035837 [Coryphaenoides rupestris]